MKKRKHLYVIIFIFIVIGTFLFFYTFTRKNYIDDISLLHEIYIYEDALKINGKPNKEIVGRMKTGAERRDWLVYYDELIIVYSYDDQYNDIGGFLWAQIDGDRYKFGDKNVCVGMKKREIEWIFKNSKLPKPSSIIDRILYDENGDGSRIPSITYYDDVYDHGIGFVYDENDVVEHIFLYFGL